MSEKRIAETISIRVNVGNFQHIEITKYAEKSITYENQEEMLKKEDELTNELVDKIVRNMRRIPAKLGKNVDTVEVEEAIKKTIPRWLEENPVPNIANQAERKQNVVVAEQKEQRDIVEKDEFEETKKTEIADEKENPKVIEKDDLFGGKKEVEVSENAEDVDDLFN